MEIGDGKILLEKDGHPMILFPGHQFTMQVGDGFFMECIVIRGQASIKGLEDGLVQIQERKNKVMA